MLKRFSCFFALVAILSWNGASASANVDVSPVVLHMDKVGEQSTITITNPNAKQVAMHVEVLAWSRIDGTDSFAETKNVIVTPSIVSLNSGDSIPIKLTLKKPSSKSREAMYRLVLTEIPIAPPPSASMTADLRALDVIRIPIYVSPAKVIRNVEWQVRFAADGNLVAVLTNKGNSHYRIRSIALKTIGKNIDTLAQNDGGGVVFPNESREFALITTQPFLPRNVQLEVNAEGGIRQVLPLIASSS
jgi:P pilus assembly chaperone PapD